MLQAPLPETLPAAAPRDIAVTSLGLQRLVSLAPGLGAGELRERLATVLGTSPAAVEGELALYGGEIAYLLSEDPGFRQALLQPSRGAQAAGATARAPQVAGTALGEVLARVASPSLAARSSS